MNENKEFQGKIKELMTNSEFLHYFHNTIEINYAVFFILFSVVWSKEKSENAEKEAINLVYPVKIKYFGNEMEITAFRIITSDNGYGNVIFIDKTGEETSMEIMSGIHLMEAAFSVLSNYSKENLEYILKNVEGNVDRFLNEHNKHEHEHGEGCGCGHEHDHDHEHGHGDCNCGHHHGE